MKRNLTLSVLFAVAFVLTSLTTFAQGDIPFGDLPPTNEFGKCYAKCKIPDVYETVSTQVLVKEESTKLSKVPAQYETQTETIMTKEGRTDLKVIPATYRTVTEQVLVKSEEVRIKTIPAKYSTESRQVLVSEARGQWVKKKKDPNCFSDNPEDCYIACYEEIPAKYRTESYKVLATPAQTIEEVIPAKYTTVTRRVIDQPARTVEVPVEPQYKTVKKTVLVSPASANQTVIPAEYKTVTEKKLVSKGGYTVWTEILCASKTSTSTVRALQKALNDLGYNAGVVDGVLGLRTQTALQQFQTDKGLPLGNLNIETLSALGINY